MMNLVFTKKEYSYKDCMDYARKIDDAFFLNNEKKNGVIFLCCDSQEIFWSNYLTKVFDDISFSSIKRKIKLYLVGEVPLPYLTNRFSFCGIDMFIEKGVFIPQKETELLVDKILEFSSKFWNEGDSLNVLEIGVGSGCCLSFLKSKRKNWKTFGTDINKKALKVADINIKKISSGEESKLFMKSFFPECEKKFDIIFSNPPYLSIEEYKGLPSIVKKQPFEALVSENKGLFFYEKIIKDSKYFLKKKYLMAFEMSQYQSNKIIKLVIKYVPYASFFVFTDLEKRQRVILIWSNLV